MSSSIQLENLLDNSQKLIYTTEGQKISFLKKPALQKGILQSIMLEDSTIANYNGDVWHKLPLAMNFTPKNKHSKILITSNISLTHTATTTWTRYTMRIKVGDYYPYSRYVGCDYTQSYAPVQTSYQYDSWEPNQSKEIAIEISIHQDIPEPTDPPTDPPPPIPDNTHQYNRKVWSDGFGPIDNTSYLHIMEILT